MSPGKNFLLALAVIALLLIAIGIASVVMLKTTVIVLSFDEGTDVSDDTIAAVTRLLNERIKAFGPEINVRSGSVKYSPPHFVVKLRGYSDLSAFANVLLRKDEASLHLVAQPDAAAAAEKTGIVPEGFKQHVIIHEFLRLGANYEDTEKREEPVLLLERPEIVLKHAKSVDFQLDGIDRRPVITITFNEADGKAFAALTAAHKGSRLALVVDGEVFSAPSIEAEVPGGVVQIRNIVNVDRARKLYNILRIGALPAPLKVVSIQPPGGANVKPDAGNKDRPQPTGG